MEIPCQFSRERYRGNAVDESDSNGLAKSSAGKLMKKKGNTLGGEGGI